MTETATLRPLQADDLGPMLAWRNHPQVRRWMISRHEIQPQEHQRWFERISADGLCLAFIARDSSGPLGFVQFNPVQPGCVAQWGFYAVPGAPRGTGQRLCRLALEHAFGPLSLHKVCGEVLAGNTASLRLHARLGFVQEGVLRQHQRTGDHWQDLVCWGLLHSEWAAAQTRASQPFLPDIAPDISPPPETSA